MNSFNRVYLAGHGGMVGSAIVRAMDKKGQPAPITASHSELDLCNQQAVNRFLKQEKPDAIIIAAAKVGGIEANRTQPAEFIYENLMIASNLIHGAFELGIEQVLFLGSSCIYPRDVPQPINEASLMTAPLEPTNEAYAIAKIAGLKLCQFYRQQHGVLYHSAMPTNLYGPGDNYHLKYSHVMPAMIRKFVTAKAAGDPTVPIWGSGKPLREFLHVDDLAEASLFLMGHENPPDWANIGSGQEVSIRELAETVKSAVGYEGEIVFDTSMPDGTPRKRLDCSLMDETGWSAKINLIDGVKRTVADYLFECKNGTVRGQ